MINVLITGVNGYIGSLAAKRFVEDGHIVTGIDISASQIKNLIEKPNFHFFSTDITDKTTFPNELKRTNVLIHCAALVHRRSKDLSKRNYFRVNVKGTNNLISFLDKNILTQIIFLSTISVFGISDQFSIPDENTALHPIDYYGESKAKAEEEIRDFSLRSGIPHTILRLTPVYGETFLLNINKRVYLPKKIAFYTLGSGEQKISLCSVHNVIDVITASMNNHKYFNETYIVKDRNDYSIKGVIDALKKTIRHKNKITIWIPLFFVEAIFRFIAIILPIKGKSLNYQLKKISRDFVYSGNKLISSGIQLKWDLNNTL